MIDYIYILIKPDTDMVFLQTYEQIKLTQLHKYHQAPSDEERAAIEIDPLTIFYAAVENCKPILMTQRARRGGITYTVSYQYRGGITYMQ